MLERLGMFVVAQGSEYRHEAELVDVRDIEQAPSVEVHVVGLKGPYKCKEGYFHSPRLFLENQTHAGKGTEHVDPPSRAFGEEIGSVVQASAPLHDGDEGPHEQDGSAVVFEQAKKHVQPFRGRLILHLLELE